MSHKENFSGKPRQLWNGNRERLIEFCLDLKQLCLFIFGCAGPLLLHRLFSSCGMQASLCGGFSCCGALTLHQLRVVAHGLHCSMACGIFPDQGSNSGLQHWQVDSLALSHQGSLFCFLAKDVILARWSPGAWQYIWRCWTPLVALLLLPRLSRPGVTNTSQPISGKQFLENPAGRL